MIKKVIMRNLICSNCAGRIEKALTELPYINSASFNFPNQVMLIDATDEYDEENAIPEIRTIVDSIEDGVDTYSYDKRHFMETKKEIETYYTFFIGVAIYLIGYIFEYFDITIGYLSLYWLGYVFIAYKIARKTYKGIRRGQVFDENTLMFIATIAAMALNHYYEAALVIIFYTVGEYLQHQAVHRSKQEVSTLIDLKIEYANKIEGDKVIIVDPLSIVKGDRLVVKNGEKIPVDGTIVKGTTSLNTSALTGEAKLSTVKLGDYVLSGNINVGSVIEIEAKKEYTESTIAKMIDLIENSTNHKARPENFITKFARYYTPTVTVAAFLMFLIPTLFDPNNFQRYIYSAAIFLVVSCPCALVLSVPLSYFAGIGSAARKGILFKGSSFLHMATNVDVIGIDKTGTLTHGNFEVTDFSDQETLKLAASIERYSNHPIAQSIVNYYEGDYYDFENVEEVPGYGLVVTTEEGTILAGNRKLLTKHKVKVSDKKNVVGSNVFISKYGRYIGRVIISDTIKDSSRNVIRRLSQKYHITMLTGDNKAIATTVADDLGNINFVSSLLPDQKVDAFNQLKSKKNKMFVGDGINDAPLLKNADIGVAMGDGSEIAIDVADVVIMGKELTLLEQALNIAHKTKNIVYQNIIFSLSIKFLFLVLAGFDMTTMLMAIFADVGITLIAVVNSLRLIYTRGNKNV
ncbi:heavy metal translocating P-type ATPase [Candidatus Xianfuyuplasma coldseepsis]|uniref:Cadmium-translocating P-type ATPase n=1 Tax=Candidatus Xianfuyuplasma coldseepsis TaxID=2782163 RepID=A0A7L7KTG8_9MOLU|nr:heavy metal translocating P-type ATPase [Xianfuyuplasma coldseepsis]QMS85536.1 cadmium-translocating P-type ATPase [Xianfuyuplasma coldseepsis]